MSDSEPPNATFLEREAVRLTGSVAASDKTFGRQAEVAALATALAGGRSVVLLGPPGVGKTAVIEKLLHYLREGRLPDAGPGPARSNLELFRLSTTELCADTRYTGMQEDRIRLLCRESTPERVVWVTDIWNLPTAGSYDTNPRGIYDLMRPAVEARTLVLVGEMTVGRWDKLRRAFPALERDFLTIDVAEPTDEATRDILVRTAAALAAEVRFERTAIDRVLSLARKFLAGRSFPGKGVDLLKRVAQVARGPSGTTVDVELVERTFADSTGLPLHMISPRVRFTHDDMRSFLAERVLGQDEAVLAVADQLTLYKAGLQNPERPAGVLLFVGPTGVGKTELAKATTTLLFGSADRMLRVDMSEYKDFHSFEKLIGDPRSSKPGLLTDHVRRHPFSVVLLDEFEKGHENLADLFLQLFDDGRLTDAFGDTVSFHHVLVILTSNVGSALPEDGHIGFGDGASRATGDQPQRSIATRVRRGLEQHYRPEFLNRIDRILVFRQLDKDDVRRVAQRELGKLYRREGLLERDLLVEVDEGVVELVVEQGFHPRYGARPLQRAIQETLVVPLARALLANEPGRFQLLRIARKGDGVAVLFEDTDASRRLVRLERKAPADDGEGHVVRLSLGDVRAGLRDVRTRLRALAEGSHLEEKRSELRTLEDKATRPGFWEEALGAKEALVRRHHLAVEVGRLDDLVQRVELLDEAVETLGAGVAADAPRDVRGELARLLRALARADRELGRMTELEQRGAVVRVRPVGGKPGAETWAEELLQMYAAWARNRQYDVELSERTLRVLGPYAFGYLRGERGGHRLIAPPSRGAERGETFLARVDVEPDGGAVEPPRAPPRDDDQPIRTYDTWRARGVKDRVSGVTVGDVKKVLAGKLDPFVDPAPTLAPPVDPAPGAPPSSDAP